jgi:hypothetical protein
MYTYLNEEVENQYKLTNCCNLIVNKDENITIYPYSKIVADVHYLADFNTRVVCESVNFLKCFSRGTNQ